MFTPRALFLTLGFASLLPGAIFASPALQERVEFSNVTRGHGMRPGEIRALFQDRHGSHWMASEAGLTKFDGLALTHYDAGEGMNAQVPKNIVALAQDLDDSLWLGSNGQGLCRFEPGWGIRERFDVSSGLAHDCVTSLQSDPRGCLWIGTRAGLNWMDRKNLSLRTVRIQPDAGQEEVLKLELNPDGTLWAALSCRGIYRKTQDGPWTLLWRSDSSDIRTALAPNGKLWAFLDEDGLLELSASGSQVHFHDFPRWLQENSAQPQVLALDADDFGVIWLGTDQGLLKYVPSGQRWARFTHDPDSAGSLVPGRITSLLEDRRSLLWAGSDTGEVSWHHLARSWFPGFSAEPGSLLSNQVNGFSLSRDGGVWIATGRGLNRLDLPQGQVRQTGLEAEPAGSRPLEILCVWEDHAGQLWVGTKRDGLAMRKPDQSAFHFFRHLPSEPGSIPEGAIVSLFEDHEGRIWAAVAGSGLVRYQPESGTFTSFLPGKHPSELLFVNDIEGDGKNGAWLATVGGGLWHLDTETGGLLPLRDYLPAMRQDLPCDNLLDVLRSRKGELWIGTFGAGLVRLTPESGAVERFDHWEGRLPAWSACSLAEDHLGMIWAATTGGLLRIDPQQGGVRRFGIQDGLQSTAFRARAVQRLTDGRLLLGSSSGFNLIDPERLPAEMPAPRPLLTGLELNGEPVNPSSGQSILQKPLALTDELHIPFDARMRFSIRYGTVYFADEDQVWFRFRMDPLDATWQKGTPDRRATYQGLKPGNYQFVVQTSRDGQSWNSPISSVQLTILPPWYRTWWANLLGLLALAALSAGLSVHLHCRQAAEQRVEKERLENERNRAEAALARQLQHSMLVEQTVADFRKRLNAHAIFEGTLERLATHLRLSRCLVFWQPEGERPGRILSEYLAPGQQPLGQQIPWAGQATLQTVLRSDCVFTQHRRNTLGSPEALEAWETFWGPGVASILAVRTVHEQRPNGVLVLQSSGLDRDWSEDEQHLAESIAGHLGVALAQFELSERETNYRRELEQARLKADAANRAKSEFLAKMTHELRTPLSAIIGYAELLEKEGRPLPEQRDGLDVITSSAEHLLGVINQVLEMSKLEAGKAILIPEEVNFPKMLRSVHGMLSVSAARKKLRFELIKLSPLPEWVEIDKSKLRQILVNLLGNAVKFTEKGGVSLRVHAKPRADANTTDSPPGRRALGLVFEVLDTGPGIGEEELPRLFQNFSQTQSGKVAKEGTGLGLAIAKGFAELMGGSIHVISRQGMGTLFTVHLPAWELVKEERPQVTRGKDTPAAEGLPAPLAEWNVPPGLRVLVAEDQHVNRLLLQKVLQRVGCVVEEAENGLQAVEKWQTFRPDIILMDESMPIMPGTEAVRQILARAGEVRPAIISLTAFAMAEQREAALAAGCIDFLAKPFKQEDLYTMLTKYAPGARDMREAA